MENAKKMVRKASKLQQHQIMKILQPTLDERLKNIGPTCSSAADVGEGALDGFPDAYLLQLHPESRWGFDEELKQRELTATAARFFIVRARINHSPSCPCSTSSEASTTVRPVAYAHFRTHMDVVMCTVFSYNESSIDFFRKNGYDNDRTCIYGKDRSGGCLGRDYLVLSKPLNIEKKEKVGEKS
uniref:N-acetyltransferase domain-containing protein n=1 Tax=Meloidogyne hapla TaxID=6305 RepID=A0A1I8B6K6_MELHA